MRLVTWLLGFDPEELLDELRRIREALEHFVYRDDIRRKREGDLYKPRTFQSEK